MLSVKTLQSGVRGTGSVCQRDCWPVSSVLASPNRFDSAPAPAPALLPLPLPRDGPAPVAEVGWNRPLKD
jgi:hypothetical protein